MPHDRNNKEIKIGSIIKGPNVSAQKGVEFVGIVHAMRTGQTCSGDATPLAVITTLEDGTRIIDRHPNPHFNGAFDAGKVTLID